MNNMLAKLFMTQQKNEWNESQLQDKSWFQISLKDGHLMGNLYTICKLALIYVSTAHLSVEIIQALEPVAS